jgi:hypothetical protein
VFRNDPRALVRVTSCPHVQTYYDDRIQSVVRFRIDPPPRSWFWSPQTDGWQSVYNSLTGLRLSVTDEAIEVQGFGPFRRLIEAFVLAKLSLPPRETTMWTVRLRRIAIGPWRAPHSRFGPQTVTSTDSGRRRRRPECKSRSASTLGWASVPESPLS